MRQLSISLIVAAALATAADRAQASGYRFGSQSVAAQGTADANGAEANDPSAIFYNPAGLAQLDGLQISLGATVVLPRSRYTDLGSTHFTGQPAGGTETDDYLPDAVLAPSFYLSKKNRRALDRRVGLVRALRRQAGFWSDLDWPLRPYRHEAGIPGIEPVGIVQTGRAPCLRLRHQRRAHECGLRSGC